MQTQTKADIEQSIRRIRIRFGLKLNIDWMSGRPRIMREDNGRYLSPRGTKPETLTWLYGFEEGCEEMLRLKPGVTNI